MDQRVRGFLLLPSYRDLSGNVTVCGTPGDLCPPILPPLETLRTLHPKERRKWYK